MEQPIEKLLSHAWIGNQKVIRKKCISQVGNCQYLVSFYSQVYVLGCICK